MKTWGHWNDGAAIDAAGHRIGPVRFNRVLRLCQLILGERRNHPPTPRVGDRVLLTHADSDTADECVVVRLEPPITIDIVVFAYE